SPAAIMPVMEIWVRMLAKLPRLRKDGLARLKKITRNSSVMKGAMLRSCPRSQLRWRPLPSPAAASAGPFIGFDSYPAISHLRRGQKTVFAHDLDGELAHDLALLHHQDAVGERQHGLRLGRYHDDAESLGAQAAHNLQNVVLGAHVHAAGRLAEDQHLG